MVLDSAEKSRLVSNIETLHQYHQYLKKLQDHKPHIYQRAVDNYGAKFYTMMEVIDILGENDVERKKFIDSALGGYRRQWIHNN